MISITKDDLLQDKQVELEIHHLNENLQILKLKALWNEIKKHDFLKEI